MDLCCTISHIRGAAPPALERLKLGNERRSIAENGGTAFVPCGHFGLALSRVATRDGPTSWSGEHRCQYFMDDLRGVSR